MLGYLFEGVLSYGELMVCEFLVFIVCMCGFICSMGC